VALEAAAAVLGVGVVVGAAAACHGEGARSANRAIFRFRRHAQVARAGFDHVGSGNDVLFAELRRWRARQACARPPIGRPIFREILNSENLVCEPGNGGLAIEECVWRARPETSSESHLSDGFAPIPAIRQSADSIALGACSQYRVAVAPSGWQSATLWTLIRHARQCRD
jgi:hypothetical protein